MQEDADKQPPTAAAPAASDGGQSAETEVISAMQSSIGKAMAELSNVSKLLAVMQADMAQVKKDSAGLRTDVNGVIQRLEAAESRISDLEDENASLRPLVEGSVKKYSELEAAVQDGVFRDKRQNLVLVGLKETLENGKPEICVRKIIDEALGIQLDPAQLQRVHRVPGGRVTDVSRPPRPIVMRFLCFLEKEKVFAAAKRQYREGLGVEWEGCKLSFFQDLPREWSEKRKKFSEVREKLHSLDVRFTVAPPAQMRFTWNGKRMRFDDHRRAMEFLKRETSGKTSVRIGAAAVARSNDAADNNTQRASAVVHEEGAANVVTAQDEGTEE